MLIISLRCLAIEIKGIALFLKSRKSSRCIKVEVNIEQIRGGKGIPIKIR